MQYHRLGNSELFVSEISLGCMSFAKDQGENTKIVAKALDRGINFFDTADLYDKGQNEMSLGKALKGKRDKVIIASKVGNQWRTDGSGWDWNPSKDYILSSVHKSLERLGTDYLDLYQLHGGTIEDPIDEAIEAFEILQKKGLIRYYGISSIRPNVIKAWAERSRMSSVMMQYSLLDRRAEEFCLNFLQEFGISVLVRGALAKGILATKEAQQYLSYRKEEIQSIKDKLAALSSQGRTSGQIALKYCLGHAAVASLVCGASNSTQILDNSTASVLPHLPLAERIELQSVLKPLLYEKHRI